MKKPFLAAVILILSFTAFGQKIPAEMIVGTWQCDDYKIEIFKSGDTFSGKLLWAKDMFEADGKTSKKDTENPDKKLRNRPRQGLVHITNLVYEDGEYIDGSLYSVQDGNTYSIKGKLTSLNSLETRGYKGIPIMGKTFKWKRVKQ